MDDKWLDEVFVFRRPLAYASASQQYSDVHNSAFEVATVNALYKLLTYLLTYFYLAETIEHFCS